MFDRLRRLFTPGDRAAGPAEKPDAAGLYEGLRSQALSLRREQAGIPEPSSEAPAWGILMETGYTGATVTLLSLADGTASLYFSSGGGVIGGQAHEAVRQAVAGFITA